MAEGRPAEGQPKSIPIVKNMEPNKNKRGMETEAEMIQRWCGEFEWWKENGINDLPAKIVTPDDPNYYRYKCRGNFLWGTAQKLDYLLRKGFVKDSEGREKIQDYLDYYVKVIRKRERTQAEDITKTDEIMDYLIEHWPSQGK
jgi:hypothetical protein